MFSAKTPPHMIPTELAQRFAMWATRLVVGVLLCLASAPRVASADGGVDDAAAKPRQQALMMPDAEVLVRSLAPLLTLGFSGGQQSWRARRCALEERAQLRWRCEEVRVEGKLRAEEVVFDGVSGALLTAHKVTFERSSLTLKAFKRGLKAHTFELRGVEQTQAEGSRRLSILRLEVDEGAKTRIAHGLTWVGSARQVLGRAQRAVADARGWQLEQLKLPGLPELERAHTGDSSKQPAGVLPPQLSVVPDAKVYEVGAQSAIGAWRGVDWIIGARAAFGQHFLATLTAVTQDDLTLNLGYDQRAQRMAWGLSGQQQLGAPLNHLGVQWEDPGSVSAWRAEQLGRGAWFRPWRRRRIGAALSSPHHELSVVVNQDMLTLEESARDEATTSVWVRGALMQEHASWAALQLKLEHLTSGLGEQSLQADSVAHTSALSVLEELRLGSPSRLYAAARGGAKFLYEISDAEQGWATNTSAGVNVQLELGATIEGRPTPSTLHSIRLRAHGVAQLKPLNRRDSLLTQPLPASRRSAYQALYVGADQQLTWINGWVLSAPMMALFGRTDKTIAPDAPLASGVAYGAKLQLAKLGHRSQASLTMIKAEELDLSLDLQGPAWANISPTYQWSGLRRAQLGYAMLLQGAPGSTGWQDGLEQAIFGVNERLLSTLTIPQEVTSHRLGLRYSAPHSQHSARADVLWRAGNKPGEIGDVGGLLGYQRYWEPLGWGARVELGYSQAMGAGASLGLSLERW